MTDSQDFDEFSIIDDVLAGQHYRFEEIVVAYQSRLLSWLFATLGSRQDAEDVAQDAFTIAYRRLSSFERRSSFYTWLHRIAYNAAIDFRRKEKKHRRMAVNIEPLQNALASEGYSASRTVSTRSNADTDVSNVATATTAAMEFEKQETIDGVYRALTFLEADRRNIIALRDLQGLNYEEIAECLSIPLGTVRSRLHRARLELKEILMAQGVWGSCT